MPKNKTVRKHLISLKACPYALKWLGDRTAQQAWDECKRADWLLWWAAMTDRNTRQEVVLVACGCAELALQFVPEGENRPREAINIARLWAKGKASPEEVRAAARAAARAVEAAWAAAEAAWAAAWAARAAEAAWAAEAAAWAAWAAAEAARAAWAARAAEAAAEAAWAARAAEAAEHEKMCIIIRQRLTCPWIEPEGGEDASD